MRQETNFEISLHAAFSDTMFCYWIKITVPETLKKNNRILVKLFNLKIYK